MSSLTWFNKRCCKLLLQTPGLQSRARHLAATGCAAPHKGVVSDYGFCRGFLDQTYRCRNLMIRALPRNHNRRRQSRDTSPAVDLSAAISAFNRQHLSDFWSACPAPYAATKQLCFPRMCLGSTHPAVVPVFPGTGPVSIQSAFPVYIKFKACAQEFT